MNKKNYLVSILITVTALFCSRFDDVTSVGKEVVRDIDPSLVNFDENFETVSLNKSTVSEKFSIPDLDCSESGVHVESFVAVGSDNGENATGYFEFRLNSDTRQKFIKSKSIKDIFIQFDLDSLSEKVENLNLFLADTLYKYKRSNIATDDTLRCGTLTTDSVSYRASFSLDSLIADSIFSICKDLKPCDTSSDKNQKKSCDSLNQPDILSFLLTNSDSSGVINIFRNARMVINVVQDSTAKKDSVKTLTSSFANYVVHEDKGSIDSLSSLPISSFASRRTAVFKTDLSSLWDIMSDDSGPVQYNEILSAAVRVWGTTIEKETDSLIVEGFISDKLYSSSTELDSLFRYSSVAKGESGDTLLLKSDRFIQKVLSNRPSMVYVYLRVNRFVNGIGIWDKVLWNEPELNVILTTLK